MSKRLLKYQSVANIVQPRLPALKKSVSKEKRNAARKSTISTSFSAMFPSQAEINTSISDDDKESLNESIKSDLYTVEIYSNWGNPQRMSCSAIWFLDENRLRIKPIKIRSFPECGQDNLMKLSDHILLKNSESDVWSVPWPVDEYKYYTLGFLLPANKKPYSCRIWNTVSSGDSSIREVVVQHNADTLFKGEIPMSYGADIRLIEPRHEFSSAAVSKSMLMINQMFMSTPKLEKLQPNDKFGLWPLTQTKRIDILFLTNHGNKEYVGLNAIDLFDENYDPIEMDQIEDVLVENSKNFTNPAGLFKAIKETTEENDMFIMSVKWEEKQTPTISIILKKPRIISQLVFWNYNYNKKLDAGINHTTVKINKKVVWIGKVRKACGVKGSVGLSTTPIWLNDIPELRKKEYHVNNDFI